MSLGKDLFILLLLSIICNGIMPSGFVNENISSFHSKYSLSISFVFHLHVFLFLLLSLFLQQGSRLAIQARLKTVCCCLLHQQLVSRASFLVDLFFIKLRKLNVFLKFFTSSPTSLQWRRLPHMAGQDEDLPTGL